MLQDGFEGDSLLRIMLKQLKKKKVN